MVLSGSLYSISKLFLRCYWGVVLPFLPLMPVWSLQLYKSWDSTQYDHNTLIQYSIDACLSHCWSCTFYQEKNPCSVGIFYPPECLSHETEFSSDKLCRRLFSLCPSPLPLSLSLPPFFPHSTFFLCLLSLSLSCLALLHISTEMNQNNSINNSI